MIVSSGSLLAGHVSVGDFAIIGGNSSILQFTRIGKMAMIGGGSAVDKDIPPYSSVSGNRAQIRGVNVIGLRRKNTPFQVMRALKFSICFLLAKDFPSFSSFFLHSKLFSGLFLYCNVMLEDSITWFPLFHERITFLKELLQKEEELKKLFFKGKEENNEVIQITKAKLTEIVRFISVSSKHGIMALSPSLHPI